jgi:hypothetical protein
MTTHEFWRETDTGEVWAVELEDRVVVRTHGPLHWSEIAPGFLEQGYDYRTEDAAELEARREEFELLDEASVILIAGSVD